jgi:YD repeat-containing protein
MLDGAALGHTTTGIYDPLNRLIGMTDGNGGITDFSYDALRPGIGVRRNASSEF